jgi:hypothetical protein
MKLEHISYLNIDEFSIDNIDNILFDIENCIQLYQEYNEETKLGYVIIEFKNKKNRKIWEKNIPKYLKKRLEKKITQKKLGKFSPKIWKNE